MSEEHINRSIEVNESDDNEENIRKEYCLPRTNEENVQGMRILEEWKVNIELHKWHDNLKQTRFRYFLAIQTALFAGLFGLFNEILKPNSQKGFLAIAVIALAIYALLNINASKRMNQRAYDYVQHVKNYIRLLEKQWNEIFPNHPLSTYQLQYEVLSLQKKIVSGDPPKVTNFRPKSLSQSANESEILIMDAATCLWILAIFGLLSYVFYMQ